MEPILALILGIEVQRFAGNDDVADSLSGSLDALQSGAWTLSPYEGPVLRPYLRAEFGEFSIGLAPAASWRTREASAADGRAGTLRVIQWELETRMHWEREALRLGVDGGWSSGRAQINGESIASPTQQIHIAPNIGLCGSLTDELSLVGRFLWPIEIWDDQITHGPRAAVALEWRP